MQASDNNNSRGPAFWLNAGIVAVAILMAATVAVSVRGIGSLYHAQEQVLRSQQSMLGLERLLSLAKDAETGQRGYLLTGDEQYLKPYRDALAAFEQQWQSVERSVHDGPAQRPHLARLKELFAAKLEELAMTVATRRERRRSGL